VPGQPGIVLVAPRVHVLEPRARCIVSGSYRLPVPPRFVAAEPGAAGEGVHAVVPVTLAMTAEDFPGPFVAALHIACTAPLEPAEPHPLAKGRFSFDLMTLPGLPQEPRTRYLYAFSGEAASEAATVSFVP